MIRQGMQEPPPLRPLRTATGVDELVGGGMRARHRDRLRRHRPRQRPPASASRKAVQKGTILHRGLLQLPDEPALSRRRHGRALPAHALLPRDRHRHPLGVLEGAARRPDPKASRTTSWWCMENPFGELGRHRARWSWCRPSGPDVTLDPRPAGGRGRAPARIAGLSFADVEQAKAAKHVVAHLRADGRPGRAADRPRAQPDPRHHRRSPWCRSPTAPIPTACYRLLRLRPGHLKRLPHKAATDDGPLRGLPRASSGLPA
ncbi:MAG: hypothetical protein MZV70_12765 [Desulfobacterales bacterium]|nr:hypothetical protein [Desulfobacterales bacterium]